MHKWGFVAALSTALFVDTTICFASWEVPDMPTKVRSERGTPGL